MPARLIVFFLAFALLWSGFSTFEAPNALSPASLEQQHDTADADGRAGSHQGSVEDHHLDDLPIQVQNDPPTDAPELAPVLRKPIADWSARTLPQTWLSAAASSPLLAGPLRPPAGAALAG